MHKVLRQVGQADQCELHLPKYRGESSRTAYSRNKNHLASYKQMKEVFIWDHTAEKHEGVRCSGDGQADYRMWMNRTDRYPMRRII